MDDNKQLIPKSEAEAVMTMVKDMASVITQRDIDINKLEIEADERKHKTNVSSATSIVISILILGCLSGIITIFVGKAEIGVPIISSTITGAFGFLGGRSFGK